VPDDVHARAMALVHGEGDWSPPAARDAATVCLLRDAEAGMQVFLMRRPRTMRFAAGMQVFPGGAIEAPDVETPFVAGADFSDVGRRAATSAPKALVAAAVRETFEECGVLLAVRADGAPADPLPGLAADRTALDEGRLGLGELLALRGLALDPGLLPLIGHWITPEVEPRRFDTRFFAAAMPAGQVAGEVGSESDGSGWWTPSAALEQVDTGGMQMLPPTSSTLHWLATFRTVADALAAARGALVRPLLPRPVPDGARGIRWVMTDGRTGAELDSADTSVTAVAGPDAMGV
jgi:8-oxo-dGTP pyrophosphatase MutT (NUDIX family)